ncbi:MAG TPA: MOP flippase family protein [Bryobacteraceae bacterium]|jgi:PST family polysaccharide transporter|nr:MOP flippase family protein [Bryobacteraceae bacterium]
MPTIESPRNNPETTGLENAGPDVSAAAPSLTKRAVAGTAWSSLSTAGRQILSVASVATVARLLGPSAYGVMGMANLLIVFILNFRDLGTGSAIIQRKTISNTLISSLFWVNFCLGLFLAAIVCAASPATAAFFKTPDLIPILCTLSISFWLTSCGVVHSSLIIREMRFRALAIADLSAAVMAYLVALTFAYRGFGVWSLVFANLANSATACLGYWIGSRWRPSWEFSLDSVKSIAKYSLNLSGSQLINYFSRNADNITVGKVLGKAPLGDYQMAYNLMLTPIQNISAVIAQATFPAFARIQDDNERFRAAYTRSCMLIALISFPVMAGMGVIADPMIRSILGEKWVGAIRVFQILAPVGLVQSVQTTVGQIYMAKSRTDIAFRWNIAACILLVSSFLIGIHWGILGVATAYCIAFLGFTVIPGFLIPFRLIGLKLSEFARALLPQILITAGMTVACLGWMKLLNSIGAHNSWFILSSTVILGAAVYILSMLLVWPPVLEYLETVMTASGRTSLALLLTRAKGLGFRTAR